MYIHMCTLYTYMNTYMPRFSPSGFFGPSSCLVPTPRLTIEYPICAVCVCVCVYTHIFSRTLPPALKIEKTQIIPPSLLLSKISPHANHKCPHRLSEPPNSRSPTLNEQTAHAWAHMHIASVYANVYTDAHNTCLTYTPAHAWCSRHLCKCMHTLRRKRTCAMRFYATVQKPLCHGICCELILSLARTLYRLSFAARPAVVSTKSVTRRCSLKKSVQIHANSWRGRCCSVAQASFDHPRWCRPHPVCFWFALALGLGPLILHTKSYFHNFFGGFSYRLKNTILEKSCNLHFQSSLKSLPKTLNRETARSEAVKRGPLFGVRVHDHTDLCYGIAL